MHRIADVRFIVDDQERVFFWSGHEVSFDFLSGK